MRRDAKGILAIWHDIRPDREADTLDWYDREHHAERLSVPGFLSARRHHAVAGRPKLFIRYETTGPEVLGSAPYLARINGPTDWTLRAQPTIVDTVRTVYRIADRRGAAEGGLVATLRFEPRAEAPAPTDAAWRPLADAAEATRSILAAEFWIADRERTGLPSREKELRGAPDSQAGAAIAIHASALAPLEAFLAEHVPQVAAHAVGAPEVGIYALVFAAETGWN